MLIDRYAPEDVFARVPELAEQTDPVLRHLDGLLDDDPLVAHVKADLGQRYPHTLDHGPHSTPVEVILRLLVIQHLYTWSFGETVRRVSDSLVLRWFCRVSCRRVPHATTLERWATLIQPRTLAQLNDRVVVLAQQAKLTQGRKLRFDGTVVQTRIHHPTDSSLLTDGVRVLSRAIRRAKPLVGERLAGVRDAFRTRLRTMRRGLQTLHRLARRQGEEVAEARTTIYKKLMETAEQTVAQAEQVGRALREAGEAAGQRGQRLGEQIARFAPLANGSFIRRAAACWRSSPCPPRRRWSASSSRTPRSSPATKVAPPSSLAGPSSLMRSTGGWSPAAMCSDPGSLPRTSCRWRWRIIRTFLAIPRRWSWEIGAPTRPTMSGLRRRRGCVTWSFPAQAP